MKEVSRDFAHKTSPWRKAIAVITATALVASMSNIQAFGASEEKTTEVPKTVTVEFELDEGVVVELDGQDITSSSVEKSTEVSTSLNFDFQVRGTTVEGTTYKVGSASFGFRALKQEQPKTEQGSEEETEVISPDGDEVEDDASGSAPGEPSYPVVPDIDGDKTSSENNIVQAPTDGVVDSVDAEASEVIQKQPETQEEPIEGSETPMASGISLQVAEGDGAEANEEEADEELTDVVELAIDEDGNASISSERLKECALAGKKVVVRIQKGDPITSVKVGSWEELSRAFNTEVEKIVLVANVKIEDSIVVSGSRVIDLNGCVISPAENFTSKVMFEVPEKAKLEIIDSSYDVVKPTVNSSLTGETTSVNKPADENIAASGSYDPGSKVLTYFVSTSMPNSTTGTTTEYRSALELNMANAGAIEAQGLNELILVNGGSLVVSGGRLTNAGGNHGIKAVGATSVTMDGGFVVGNGTSSSNKETTNGAGIYFDGASKTKNGSKLTIKGSAVVGGNVVTNPASKLHSSEGSGAGLYLNECSADITGDALVVSNWAKSDSPIVTLNGDQKVTDERNLFQDSNGGGIYVSMNSDVFLGGNAVVASNTASRDGGGIYVQNTKTPLSNNSLTVAGRVNISNNQALNNMRDMNPKNEDLTEEDVAAGGAYRSYLVSPVGGGGIFSMATLIIRDAQIVNNYAGDAGGGVFLSSTSLPNDRQPLLKIDHVVVAGNYAGASEGGGIWCQPRAASTAQGNASSGVSYIKYGYITNNKTATEFDYGGGGLYVNSGGYLRLYNPLVTANTAHGFGGGVGGCHNGFVISSEAAVFDNRAEQATRTTNRNEYADRWAFEKKYLGPLDDQDGLDPAGSSSADFFSGRESKVEDTMLGGGSHKWSGWTSLTTGSRVELSRGAFTADKFASGTAYMKIYYLDGSEEEVKVYNANFEKADTSKKTYFVYLPLERFDELRDVIENSESVKVIGTEPTDANKKAEKSGSVATVTGNLEDYQGYGKVQIKLDDKYYGDGGLIYNSGDKPVAVTLDQQKSKEFFSKLSSGSTDSQQETWYRVYRFEKDAVPKNGYIDSKRFIALKANPDSVDKAKAYSEACVFVSGNYSQTNGGGIACNGLIDLGKPEGEEINPPKAKVSLTINKVWENFDNVNPDQSDEFVATFRVRVYASANMYDPDNPEKNVIDNAVKAITFKPGVDTPQQVIIEGLPLDSYVVVEEVEFAGDNYTSTVVGSFALDENGGMTLKADAQVSFKNTYKDEGAYSTSVVNSYAAGATKVEVTQDSLYLKRVTKVETNTPEEQETSTEENAPTEEAN